MTQIALDQWDLHGFLLGNVPFRLHYAPPGDFEARVERTFSQFPPIEARRMPDQIHLTHIPLPQGEGETILMVDDEVLFARVMSMVLKKNGYKVLAAAGGSDALAMYSEHAREIEIVLTDVVMPGMDGMDLTRALKEINPQVKVIASTGQITETRQAQFRALGVNMILAKPYDAKKLLTTLHSAIHGE